MFKFPQSFLKGKWIIEAHEAWAKELLFVYIALEGSRNRKVVLHSFRPWHVELLNNMSKLIKDANLNNIVLSEKVYEECPKNEDKILYEFLDPNNELLASLVKHLRYCRNVIVYVTPPIKLKLYNWSKARLKRVYGKEFLLITSRGSRLRLVIDVNYIGVVESPQGILGRALNILRKGIVEYGELTLRDAIDLISYNLGISRNEARKILGLLIQKKYVEKQKKNLIIY